MGVHLVDDRFIIRRVYGVQAIDSRGTPTIKAVVETRGGGRGYGLAPSGASKSSKEAVELRDGGRRWRGKGVSRALAMLESIVAPRLTGIDSRRQDLADSILNAVDGSGNKSRIGGNTTTAVSIAVARAAASTAGIPLYRYLGGPTSRLMPVPILNVINGGAHAGNDLAFQEFMIVPMGADSFSEAMRMAVEVYWSLKDFLKEKYGPVAVNVGDEGGYAPPMSRVEEALEALERAIDRSGYALGSDFYLGIDAAANHFYDEASGMYMVDGRRLDRGALLDLYEDLAVRYRLVYLEDPVHEDDIDGYREATRRLGHKALIVGDDLYATNTKLLAKGIEAGATNAALVKVNQVGTLTETIDFIRMAVGSGMRVIISHRSGDTEDSFIADLAVAVEAGIIKTGAPARGERTSKYNRLLEIEWELGSEARYRPFI
ncbi:MAG: phosphopyruvate hydratase [Desulfurococcales archaeon]|nr:phosphopyruvate hydratase [Desulfurococcales archaeon]